MRMIVTEATGAEYAPKIGRGCEAGFVFGGVRYVVTSVEFIGGGMAEIGFDFLELEGSGLRP